MELHPVFSFVHLSAQVLLIAISWKVQVKLQIFLHSSPFLCGYSLVQLT